jgi:DNA-binding response OmpR family regulator
MVRPRVILLEAETEYRRHLADYLREHGFDVHEVEDFDTLYDHMRDTGRAIFVLNISADFSRGLDFLKLIAERHKCSALVLSDGSDEVDRIVCLELGADDFIQKATSLREILARARAAIRRLQAGDGKDDVLEHLSMDQSARRWRFLPGQRELIGPDGEGVPLTSAEFNLLNVLAQHTGTPLSRDYLSRAVFGRAYNIMDRSIDNLVARLRRKLKDSARSPHMIKTARPVGYVFTGFPEAQGGLAHAGALVAHTPSIGH